MAIADNVKGLIPQLASEGITDALLTAYVSASLNSFSAIFPREVAAVVDVSSSNTDYDFALPVDWEERFSTVARIEYPLQENPPEYLDEEYYTLYLDPVANTNVLLFLGLLPIEDFAIYYTVSWTEDNLCEADSYSCALLTAALICDRLAAKYAGHTDSELSADLVVWSTKSREYNNVKNNFLHLFALRTGVDPRKLEPAAALGYTKNYITTNIDGLFRSITEG